MKYIFWSQVAEVRGGRDARELVCRPHVIIAPVCG